MERSTKVGVAREIMGYDFLGPDELHIMVEKLKLVEPLKYNNVPEIPFPIEMLQKCANEFILFLGIPNCQDGSLLSLNKMRLVFGIDPTIFEPCFYNQDWYINDCFANECTMNFQWYLIRKELLSATRGKDLMIKSEKDFQFLPTALICAYAFFAFYFRNHKYLWEHDFIWCKDVDNSGDRIYVARYLDPKGINKNGFNIHRHLKVKDNFGCVKLF